MDLRSYFRKRANVIRQMDAVFAALMSRGLIQPIVIDSGYCLDSEVA
jgi:hypothetical protein